MKMSFRRFTCLTNAFSKKFETHRRMVAIYFAITIFAAYIKHYA